MAYSRPGTSFDWRGFSFVTKVLVFGVLAFNFAPPVWSYAQPTIVALLEKHMPASSTPADTTSPPGTYVIPATLSTTTPQRIIRSLSITDVVPDKGKLIVADLTAMTLTLYEDGAATSTYTIASKGRPGTPWETPAGFYKVQTKEEDHFSSIGKVHMPYSMQFYGNYFIHGWPYYTGGEPVDSSFSGGCIRLSTEDAEQVFAFADINTGLFVYDPPSGDMPASIMLGDIRKPAVTAQSYLIADIDTGDVYLDRNAQTPRPIASVSKLVTALVANETISFDKKITVHERDLIYKGNPALTRKRQFVVEDLLYPLLMQSSNEVADALADYYGEKHFMYWMNATARSLGMTATRFTDPSGLSPDNVSTSDDLFKLAAYLTDKKPFVWGVTRASDKHIVAVDGSSFPISNFNKFTNRTDFVGGKIGYTDEAHHTMLSVFSFKVGGEERRVAFVVLQSESELEDTRTLVSWFQSALAKGSALARTSCATCATASSTPYRRIDF